MNLYLCSVSIAIQNFSKFLKSYLLIEKKIMRVGVVIVAIFLTSSAQLLFALPAKSQQPINEVEIKIGLKNETLLQAFKKVEEQSRFRFMYRKKRFRGSQS